MNETVCELKYGPLNGTCVVIPDDRLTIALENHPRWVVYRRVNHEKFSFLQPARNQREADVIVLLAGSRMVRQQRRRTTCR